MTNTLPRLSSERQQYYRGFDLRVREVIFGEAVDVTQLSKIERRGYDAACRAQAYAESSSYLVGQGRRGDL